MSMAYMVSMKSKDPSTRVGAVVIGIDNEIRATGYNGLPRKVSDKSDRYSNKEYKYMASNHAEENAIIQCARVGVSTKGCAMYTLWVPCARCSKMIIQAGFSKVVFDQNFPGNDVKNQSNWEESIKISYEMLRESDIEIYSFSGDIIKIEGLYKSEPFII